MNINERLQEIERVLNHVKNDSEFQPHVFLVDDLDVQWMHDTIKQLQEENEKKEKRYQELVDYSENMNLAKTTKERFDEIEKNEMRKRIEQLESENAEELQNEIDRLNKTLKATANMVIENDEESQKRIAELEKERREITAAHEAFLKERGFEKYWYKRNAEGRSQWQKGALAGFEHMKEMHDKHFQFIHLAEQVRLAKLSAGVDGK